MSSSFEIITAIIGFFITIMFFSYLLGDNPLFRGAVHIFVGVAAGYVLSVTWHQVIWPLLFRPIFTGEVFQDLLQAILLFFPLVGSALLLTKISPRMARLGQIPVAYLVGVGAAVIIGGAVLGTILPQITATIDAFDVNDAIANGNPLFTIFYGALVLIGVVGTLAFFHFGARKKSDGSTRRNFVVEALSWIGRVYIAITFGILFAGVYIAALTSFIERLSSMRTLLEIFGK